MSEPIADLPGGARSFFVMLLAAALVVTAADAPASPRFKGPVLVLLTLQASLDASRGTPPNFAPRRACARKKGTSQHFAAPSRPYYPHKVVDSVGAEKRSGRG